MAGDTKPALDAQSSAMHAMQGCLPLSAQHQRQRHHSPRREQRRGDGKTRQNMTLRKGTQSTAAQSTCTQLAGLTCGRPAAGQGGAWRGRQELLQRTPRCCLAAAWRSQPAHRAACTLLPGTAVEHRLLGATAAAGSALPPSHTSLQLNGCCRLPSLPPSLPRSPSPAMTAKGRSVKTAVAMATLPTMCSPR